MLHAEWEQFRAPLTEQIKQKETAISKRKAKCIQMMEDIKKYREEMITMIQDLKDKQERSQMLTEELGKLPKNINRAIYTHRILDITASIGS